MFTENGLVAIRTSSQEDLKDTLQFSILVLEKEKESLDALCMLPKARTNTILE